MNIPQQKLFLLRTSNLQDFLLTLELGRDRIQVWAQEKFARDAVGQPNATKTKSAEYQGTPIAKHPVYPLKDKPLLLNVTPVKPVFLHKTKGVLFKRTQIKREKGLL